MAIYAWVSQSLGSVYEKHDGDFDRIYTEEYNNASYMGGVIVPGREYELSYLECTCEKVKSGLRSDSEQCECSRQSVLYVLSQIEMPPTAAA